MEVQLTQGYIALVDDCDYDRVSNYKWFYDHGYARSCIDNRKVYLHRFVMNMSDEHSKIDHIDLNKLNCRRENLRICSMYQNNRNKPKQNIKCTSIYKGVYFKKDRLKWAAAINIGGKNYFLGHFGYQHEAANMYNKAAIKYFGEFAKLNVIPNEYDVDVVVRDIVIVR
jgi:hypothetical protein